MKLLHTSDWHLGKRLLGRDMLPYQKSVLAEIAQIAEDKQADVVVVAGDVFEGSLQPAVVGAFLDAAEAITGGGRRALVLTPGDDNPEALRQFQPLSKRYNLAVFAANGEAVTFCDAPFAVKPVESGAGYIVYETGGERAVIAAVSPKDESGRALDTAEYEKVLDAACIRFAPETVNILAAYRPPEGAAVPESCAYAALGGSHAAGQRGEGGSYCGSILAYGKDGRAEKSVQIVTVMPESVARREMVRLKDSRRFKHIRANSLADAESQLERAQGCFTELDLSLGVPLTEAENRKLRQKFPDLLRIALTVGSPARVSGAPLQTLPGAELFERFYTERNGEKPPKELTDLYLEIAEGQEE